MQKYPIPLLIILLLCLSAGPGQAAIDWQSKQVMKTKTPIVAMSPTFDGQKMVILSKGLLTIYDQKGKKLGSTKVKAGMDRIAISGFQPAGIPEKIFVANSATGQVEQVTFSLVTPIAAGSSPFLGPAEAPVTIAIFSDFQ